MSPAKSRKQASAPRKARSASANVDGAVNAAAASDGSAERTRAQSAAMPSPFPPIADYAFLSDCHTGALVAPDGSDRLAVRSALRRAERVRHAARPPGGRVPLGPFGINVPAARVYEPGTNILLTTWKTPTGWVIVRDALTLGRRRGVDHGDAAHAATDRRRRLTICSSGWRCAWRARSRWNSRASPSSTTAALPRPGRSMRKATARTPPAPTRRSGSRQTWPVGVEGDWVRARHVLKQGEQIYCALSWAEELAAPENAEEASEQHDRHRDLLAPAGSAAPAYPTTAGATRSSARR